MLNAHLVFSNILFCVTVFRSEVLSDAIRFGRRVVSFITRFYSLMLFTKIGRQVDVVNGKRVTLDIKKELLIDLQLIVYKIHKLGERYTHTRAQYIII